MIMHLAILGVGVPGMADIRGVPGITGTERSPPSIGLGGHCQQADGLALSLGAVAALGEGQKTRKRPLRRATRGGLRGYSVGFSRGALAVSIIVLIAANAVRFRCA
jgi:hypothetical protein